MLSNENLNRTCPVEVGQVHNNVSVDGIGQNNNRIVKVRGFVIFIDNSNKNVDEVLNIKVLAVKSTFGFGVEIFNQKNDDDLVYTETRKSLRNYRREHRDDWDDDQDQRRNDRIKNYNRRR